MITLLTDFGTQDYFVAALKASILTINPEAQLVDITHEVAAHDISEAAFTLSACYRDFPAGTVHLAVVDPGVGSSRRPIVVRSNGHTFVGPDNGLFDLVISGCGNPHVVHATNRKFFRERISSTFHGRDIFAPLAAHLDLGIDISEIGPQIGDCQRLGIAQPTLKADEIIGEVIHIDRFGNCITNLTRNEIDVTRPLRGAGLSVGSERVTRLVDHFADAPEGRLFAYLGSAGYIEIALWCQSAASRFGITRGTQVRIESSERKDSR
jgi:S-adenosylmethionine hydrolase